MGSSLKLYLSKESFYLLLSNYIPTGVHSVIYKAVIYVYVYLFKRIPWAWIVTNLIVTNYLSLVEAYSDSSITQSLVFGYRKSLYCDLHIWSTWKNFLFNNKKYYLQFL